MKDGHLRQRVSYEHGGTGDIVRESFVDANGGKRSNPWKTRDIIMDDGGNVIRETFFGSEGNKLKKKDGFVATITRHFSNRGELDEEAYYDETGRLMIGADGYAVIRFKREKLPGGYVVWRRYFGEDNMPMLIAKEGVASERKTFDLLGREVEWEMFGVKGEKINGALGWQRAVVEYGRDGGRVGERFFDKSGMRVRTRKEH